MSEFKFACPVCGQHITADSKDSGGQIECPTCFRKIVVPQGPGSLESKFILAASQVSKPKPLPSSPSSLVERAPAESSNNVLLIIALLAVVGAGWAGLMMFRGRLLHAAAQLPAVTNAPAANAGAPSRAAAQSYAGPTNFQWSMSLSNALYPAEAAAGKVRGIGFLCARSVLQGGQLTLRQGDGEASGLSVMVHLFAGQAEDLSGKTVEIGPERKPPLPKITVRWKNGELNSGKEEFKSGYVLRLAFGQAANQRMSGKIYLCLPDEDKSFVAGTFDAEIRKPQPPKPRPAPAPPAPKPTN